LRACLVAWLIVTAACSPAPIDTTDPVVDAAGDVVADVTPDADMALPDAAEDVPDLVMDTPEDLPEAEFALAPTERLTLDSMATSAVCADCHSSAPNATAMRDLEGASVAPHDLWRASMMAMAARDPFWLAMVEAEVAATPSARETIEATCLRCHSPAAFVLTQSPGLDVLTGTGDVSNLARDGVSCAVCHRLDPTNLGTPESFTGGFVFTETDSIFGPYADPFETPMATNTGFTPRQGDHIGSGAACGTCHNLATPALTPDGQAVGIDFPEQTTYLEWRNSSYRAEEPAGIKGRRCVACHMPAEDGGASLETRIARSPDGADFEEISPRRPYLRHGIGGGNTVMPAIIRDARQTLAPDVPAAAFNGVIDDARNRLRTMTGRVRIERASFEDGTVQVKVTIEHSVGHKFPTGFPARRAWLAVEVLDEGGEVIASSGTWDGRGRILGRDGEILQSELPGGPFQPHYDTIDSPNQVQIYESVMSDPQGNQTTTLLRASTYLKDNRLLPEGFDLESPDAATALPIGTDGDDDFGNATDSIDYHLEVGGTPQSVRVRLVYQSLGARFLAQVLSVDTPAMVRFRTMYEDADVRPELVASAEAEIR
jgi:hypothetical protein